MTHAGHVSLRRCSVGLILTKIRCGVSLLVVIDLVVAMYRGPISCFLKKAHDLVVRQH
jgi:hypothetical protein